MDPFSIVVGSASLLGAIIRLTVLTSRFTTEVSDAVEDMGAVTCELESLAIPVSKLKGDGKKNALCLPDNLAQDLSSIIQNCEKEIAKIEDLLTKTVGSRFSSGRWVLTTKRDVAKHRATLFAHGRALSLTIQLFSMTNGIEVQQNTQQILTEVRNIGSMLPRQEPNFALQRFLDDTATYATSNYAGSISDWTEILNKYEPTDVSASHRVEKPSNKPNLVVKTSAPAPVRSPWALFSRSPLPQPPSSPPSPLSEYSPPPPSPASRSSSPRPPSPPADKLPSVSINPSNELPAFRPQQHDSYATATKHGTSERYEQQPQQAEDNVFNAKSPQSSANSKPLQQPQHAQDSAEGSQVFTNSKHSKVSSNRGHSGVPQSRDRSVLAADKTLQLPPIGMFSDLNFQPSPPNPKSPVDNLVTDAPSGRPVFGVSLNVLQKRDGLVIPSVVRQCIQAVDLFGLRTKDIYQRSGSSAHEAKIRNILNDNSNKVDFRNPECFFHDVKSVAWVLKEFFECLPDTLFTPEYYSKLEKAGRIDDLRRRRDMICTTINRLPDANYAILRVLILHLNRVLAHSNLNRMSTSNLAVIFKRLIMPRRDYVGWYGLLRALETILENPSMIFDDKR